MLEVLFGSKNRERVLLFVLANGEGYAKETRGYYEPEEIERLTMQCKRPKRTGKFQ